MLIPPFNSVSTCSVTIPPRKCCIGRARCNLALHAEFGHCLSQSDIASEGFVSRSLCFEELG